LSGADLCETGLCEVDLREAYLRMADLRGANLHGTYLRGANLRGVDLRGVDLTGANLRSGIILIKEQNYQEAKVGNANFKNALINNRGFLEYLKENGAKNVPDEVSTRDEFINAMKKRGLDIGGIEPFFDE